MHQLLLILWTFSGSFLIIVGAVSQRPYNYQYNNPHRQPNYSRDTNQKPYARSHRSTTDTSFALPRTTSSTNQQLSTSARKRISRADAENAKFLGANNLEPDIESPKTFGHLKRKYLRHRLRQHASLKRCFPYGRDAVGTGRTHRASATTASTDIPRAQGRSFWDINVYNVYPSGVGLGGCLGGLHDSIGHPPGGQQFDPVYPTSSPFGDFLRLFAPGILQNSLPATARPLSSADSGGSGGFDDDVQNLPDNLTVDNGADSGVDPSIDPAVDPSIDPAVDPNYRPLPVSHRRPHQLYFDSMGATPLTPAQVVSRVATTVNGIIQQLTGNAQPVYQSQYRRSKSYG